MSAIEKILLSPCLADSNRSVEVVVVIDTGERVRKMSATLYAKNGNLIGDEVLSTPGFATDVDEQEEQYG